MLAIAEGIVVMITETTIESNLSIIVGSIVPEVLDHRVTFFRKVFSELSRAMHAIPTK